MLFNNGSCSFLWSNDPKVWEVWRWLSQGEYVSTLEVHSWDIDEQSGTCLLDVETKSESSRFSDRPFLSKQIGEWHTGIKLASISVALHTVHMHLHTQADKHMQRKSLENQITNVKENK